MSNVHSFKLDLENMNQGTNVPLCQLTNLLCCSARGAEEQCKESIMATIKAP